MVRKLRKRIKRSFSFLIYFTVGISGMILFFFLAKELAPLFVSRNSNFKEHSILKPVGVHTQVSELRALLDKKNILYNEIFESTISGAITVRIKEGTTVYFSKSEDAAWQVSSLALILSRFNIDNRKAKLIDLREGRPIVKFDEL